MSDPFLGQILLLAFTFAPNGYADCDGQLLDISQNTALFSLLGTTYGGDGRTTFALPDLRGRVPLGAQGQGPGLSDYQLGQTGGEETVTLTTAELPTHAHAIPASSQRQTTNRAAGSIPAGGGEYAPAADADADAGSTRPSGGGQGHDNLQPYLGLRYVIALQGIYPSRP